LIAPCEIFVCVRHSVGFMLCDRSVFLSVSWMPMPSEALLLDTGWT
jgi:hypothetical protein